MPTDLTPSLELYAMLFSASTLSRVLTYLGFAGLTFFVFWVWRKEQLKRYRISAKEPTRSQLWAEVRNSCTTIAIWGVLTLGHLYMIHRGWTRIYFDLGERSLGYYALSVGLFIVVHDTWFYWSHRLMHHPRLFRFFHATHHRSTNPSPWAIFSFQPTEAVTQFAVTFVFLMIPAHVSVYVVWSVWLLTWNVIGHLGYELAPRGFTRRPLLGLLNTTTHHTLHHRTVRSNYSLYFTFWDRVMGTEHPDYHAKFDDIKNGVKL